MRLVSKASGITSSNDRGRIVVRIIKPLRMPQVSSEIHSWYLVGDLPQIDSTLMLYALYMVIVSLAGPQWLLPMA